MDAKRKRAIGPIVLCIVFGVFCILGAFPPAVETTAGSEYQLQTITEEGEGYRIYAEIPILGKDGVDVSLRAQANALIDAFLLKVNSQHMQNPCQLRIQCDVWSTGKSIASVLFSAYSYMGGGQGKSMPLCKSYDMHTGNPILLENIFADQEKGLQRLEEICIQQYASWIEENKTDMDWLLMGLSPTKEHYEAFAITPEGLRIFFTPYQLGPWQAEIQGFTVSYAQIQDLFSEEFLAILLEEHM